MQVVFKTDHYKIQFYINQNDLVFKMKYRTQGVKSDWTQ